MLTIQQIQETRNCWKKDLEKALCKTEFCSWVESQKPNKIYEANPVYFIKDDPLHQQSELMPLVNSELNVLILLSTNKIFTDVANLCLELGNVYPKRLLARVQSQTALPSACFSHH